HLGLSHQLQRLPQPPHPLALVRRAARGLRRPRRRPRGRTLRPACRSAPRSRGGDRRAPRALPGRDRALLPPRGVVPRDRRDPRAAARHGQDPPAPRQAAAAAAHGRRSVVTVRATSALDRLDSILAELELSSDDLRRDPHGDGWLPAEARALVQADPSCRAALREFVEGELELWGALPGPTAAAPPVDPFFTA